MPSVLGGLVGAALLLVTPEDRFREIVPWLVLCATALFALVEDAGFAIERVEPSGKTGHAWRVVVARPRAD